MTSAPSRSGMPGHFGIRVTNADKDKLVGELDVDDRHLNNSGHVHGGALAAFADDLSGAATQGQPHPPLVYSLASAIGGTDRSQPHEQLPGHRAAGSAQNRRRLKNQT